MFDAVKITMKCKAFLKKHDVPFCDDFNIYRKLGMIHCKVEDWRGPIELDGFPTFSKDEAIFIIIDSCLSEFYFQKELENRDNLFKTYPRGYGEYDPRKYAFEKVIEVFKDYSNLYHRKAIKKYTKCLNTNSHVKSRWVYDLKKESFTTLEYIDFMAVKVYKNTGSVSIYNMEPQQARPNDNIYKYVTTIKENEYIKFVFTNNGNDRYFLYVYDYEAAEENENYILIGFADKIIWDYPYESNTITRKQYTYSYINREVNISNELIWEGNLQMKYNPEIFFNNIEYVISYDGEAEIELYDRHGNLYFLIAYKKFCDFYDKDGNYHKLESIRNIVDYVDISDIIDIHDYGLTPSIDYSRDIKEQTNVIDGKLAY